MDGNTIMYLVWGALLLGFLISALLAFRGRRLRTRRFALKGLLNDYFRGVVPIGQLDRRVRQIASPHFANSAEFYSLATAAFQRAVDNSAAPQPNSGAGDRQLLTMFAALKSEFGLTDRYQIEPWRAGRE